MGSGGDSFGRWLRDYWRQVLGLVTGIASLALTIYGAWPETSQKAAGFWLTSYVCLIVAAWSLTQDTRNRLAEAERKLAMRGVTATREQLARERLANLAENEREVLRLLLAEGPTLGRQIRERLPGVIIERINQQTPFLDRESVGSQLIVSNKWNIREDWLLILNEQMFAAVAGQNPSAVPTALLRLSRFLPGTERVLRALWECKDHIWRAMRNTEGPGAPVEATRRPET